MGKMEEVFSLDNDFWRSYGPLLPEIVYVYIFEQKVDLVQTGLFVVYSPSSDGCERIVLDKDVCISYVPLVLWLEWIIIKH